MSCFSCLPALWIDSKSSAAAASSFTITNAALTSAAPSESPSQAGPVATATVVSNHNSNNSNNFVVKSNINNKSDIKSEKTYAPSEFEFPDTLLNPGSQGKDGGCPSPIQDIKSEYDDSSPSNPKSPPGPGKVSNSTNTNTVPNLNTIRTRSNSISVQVRIPSKTRRSITSSKDISNSVLLNPFLKNDGKDPSQRHCMKDHPLKLFVSPVGKTCAKCAFNMPNGDRAWRCFACDFHLCIKCHDETEEGKYEWNSALDKTGFTNPGWDGRGSDPFGDLERKAIKELKNLLTKYLTEEYKTQLAIVKCESVIPDYSNRGHTGLSLEHVHRIAQSMQKGFRIRGVTQEEDDHSGFDIPVVVRESSCSEGGQEALGNWAGVVKENAGFVCHNLLGHRPNCTFPEPNVSLFRKKTPTPIFCSLGNGHFFQALNCFRLAKTSIFDRSVEGCENFVDQFDLSQGDEELRNAVENGVPCLVLENTIPLRERTALCELLNKLSDYRWTVSDINGNSGTSESSESLSLSSQSAQSDISDAEVQALVDTETKDPFTNFKNDPVRHSVVNMLQTTPSSSKQLASEFLKAENQLRDPPRPKLAHIDTLPLSNLIVHLNTLKQVDVRQSQFELMSKAMDGTELNCLVRLDTGQSGKSTRAGT